MVVDVGAALTVREAVPKLPALAVSPPNVALRVTLPAASPVTETWQPVPEVMVHEGGTVTLPAPDCEKPMVSPTMEPLLPETEAVHWTAEAPTVTEEGQLRVVEVEAGSVVVTCTTWEPALPPLLMSPL